MARLCDKKWNFKKFFEACYQDEAFDLSSIIVKKPVDYKDYLTNLDIIPSHIELFGMDLKLATKLGHENIKAKLFLKKALAKIQDLYSYVFIDCPPNLYLATQNGLFASDYYVIVALAEYLSTLGIAHIQKSIKSIFDEAGRLAADIGASTFSPPNLLGIIFNRLRTVEHGTYSQENIISQISGEYPNIVFEARVPQSDKIATRAEQKVPIAVSGYAADSEYETRMKKLAEEFYDRVTRPQWSTQWMKSRNRH
jgi:chromosome partitioning protein